MVGLGDRTVAAQRPTASSGACETVFGMSRVIRLQMVCGALSGKSCGSGGGNHGGQNV